MRPSTSLIVPSQKALSRITSTSWITDPETPGLDSHGMRPHTDGTEGKSQFGFYVNSGQAVLDAAAYAAPNKLWVGNKTKVPC